VRLKQEFYPMAFITSVVYAPPTAELPHLAVVFHPDGEVLIARRVSSQEAGERLIRDVAQEFTEQHNLKVVSKMV